MNLWGSFSDSSEAADCIFVQTFCFSLLISCGLEMVLRAMGWKVGCAFTVFFIHTLPVLHPEIRSRYNLAGNQSLQSVKYFPSGNTLQQKTERGDERLPG